MDSTQLNQSENDYPDFRQLLRSELVSRCRRNSKYSLRCFARDLNVSPASLSAIMNGKRPLTKKMIERLGEGLDLDDETMQSYKSREKFSSGFETVAIDTFSLISEWYHFAILELMKIEGFKADSKWISSKLGITEDDAEQAVQRLIRLNFLELIDGELIDKTSGNTTNITPGMTSLASQRYQDEVLRKGIESIWNIPLEKRNNTSLTVAINEEDLPKAQEMIRKFRRKFNKFFEKSEKTNQVYQLGVTFYPLTHNKE